MNDKLIEKLQNFLEENGYKYDFFYEDNFKREEVTDYFTSFVLRSVTGVINRYISRDFSYDIDLINKLTNILLSSKDKDLEAIAWNTFSRVNDARFILFKEIKNAQTEFNKQFMTIESNHTKVFESDRLIIKPNNKEDSKTLHRYIKSNDKDELGFARLIEEYYSIHHTIFTLKDKASNDLIGFIGFEREEEPGSVNLFYYLKKKYRKQGYAREAVKRLLEVIKRKEVIVYKEYHKVYVFEKIYIDIKKIFIRCKENNTASYKVAESLRFKYEGNFRGYHHLFRY